MWFSAVLLVISLVGTSCASSESTSTPSTPPPRNLGGTVVKQYPNPPAMTIDQNKQYQATIDTNMGKIVVQLLPKEAPIAVNSFVFLAREKFYDGVRFHRVVADFVIQTGDPTGTGAGGPGYRFPDEKVTLDYEKGILAMANAGPNTNGSQFFITLSDLTGRLPKNYTIFGRVVQGLDVVDNIGAVPVKVGASGERSSPEVDVHITTVTIEEK
ncbi:MAG: peptidylprolyl isomerase [Chloroflexi bacterium]|nr:peptidylprolyl isomerase [Chloroflexota bacterium]